MRIAAEKAWRSKMSGFMHLLSCQKHKERRFGMILAAANLGYLDDDYYGYLWHQVENDVPTPTLDGLEEWIKSVE